MAKRTPRAKRDRPHLAVISGAGYQELDVRAPANTYKIDERVEKLIGEGLLRPSLELSESREMVNLAAGMATGVAAWSPPLDDARDMIRDLDEISVRIDRLSTIDPERLPTVIVEHRDRPPSPLEIGREFERIGDEFKAMRTALRGANKLITDFRQRYVIPTFRGDPSDVFVNEFCGRLHWRIRRHWPNIGSGLHDRDRFTGLVASAMEDLRLQYSEQVQERRLTTGDEWLSERIRKQKFWKTDHKK